MRTMPELPEVETIVRNLRDGHHGTPPLLQMRVARATVRWPRHIARPSPRAFQRRIRGQEVTSVGRRGKYIVVGLSPSILLVHLKMSGDLRLSPSAEPPGRHDHTRLHFEGGWELRFEDARKFGRIYLVDDPQTVLSPLGPEPLDAGFTAARLGERLRSHHRLLKPLLMDQAFLAGLGNIYADEALHRAKLHPLRHSDSLQPAEVDRLWRGIRRALRDGLRHNGASIDWVYRGGEFQNHFRVYQRTGEPCPVCGTRIRRRVIGQRSTHYCPRCQRERHRNTWTTPS
jgi:formamidopyrimidine-DNA glycosylase